ncbi:hypothetical protein [Phyllobacterium sophorae]|uniref:Uncharacterized protein n=1 Tax=Phyllobacterium sophorae TaxID=1520277 RepID=A0A2P7BFM1_9HYPH|nr:hypothetical protein [Phyllobacterium sophorae]PSH65296.1 hypothetical protein CU103_09855 [Phyllobacterium sophorae]
MKVSQKELKRDVKTAAKPTMRNTEANSGRIASKLPLLPREYCAGGSVGQSLKGTNREPKTAMANPTSRQTRNPKGDYIIHVREAYSLNSDWMPTRRYHSGTVLFEERSGKIHFTHVNHITLKLRKRHFCVPDDATADAKARAAEYKRYVRALELYREFYRRTGQRYELLREADRSLPYLPQGLSV